MWPIGYWQQELKLYKILAGNYGFLDCLKDRPTLQENYKTIWDILSKARKGFATKNASKAQLEDTAQTCEKLTQVFPLLFPQHHITRKMHVLSIVAPKQIREQGAVYKMLKIEQQGEKLHMELNEKEKQFKNIRNKSQKYFLMLRELESSYYC